MDRLKKIWSCKIGEIDAERLPPGSDGPMRAAAANAYEKLTGERPRFQFSGWGAKLTEPERAVVEDREPTADNCQDSPYSPPPGYALVPLKPTVEMLEDIGPMEGFDCDAFEDDIDRPHIEWLTSAIEELAGKKGDGYALVKLEGAEERVARAIYADNPISENLNENGPPDWRDMRWDEMDDSVKDQYRKEAQAAIKAMTEGE